MQKIDYIEAQTRLAKTMRHVCEKDMPITINGAGKDQVVMMPLETFNKLKKLSDITLIESHNSIRNIKMQKLERL